MTMDEIVTRLRMQADVADAFPMLRAKDSAMTNWLREAANEIEHLREQNEYLKANIEMLLAEARQSKYGIEDMYE